MCGKIPTGKSPIMGVGRGGRFMTTKAEYEAIVRDYKIMHQAVWDITHSKPQSSKRAIIRKLRSIL
jgi:hypothetical protein